MTKEHKQAAPGAVKNTADKQASKVVPAAQVKAKVEQKQVSNANPQQAASPQQAQPKAAARKSSASAGDLFFQAFENYNKAANSLFSAALDEVHVLLNTGPSAPKDVNYEALSEQVAQNIDEALAFGRDNVDVVFALNRKSTEAAQCLQQELVEYYNTSAEQATEAYKAFLNCRDVSDITELQQKLCAEKVRNTVDFFVRFTESCIQQSHDALQPFGSQALRVSEAVNQSYEKFAKRS